MAHVSVKCVESGSINVSQGSSGGPAALCANVGLMCGAVSPEVLLGPLCRPKRQHLSPLHFLHGEHMNTANQYRESQS